MNIRFVEWKGKEWRAMDLPVGVRYSYKGGSGAQFIAAGSSRMTRVTNDDGSPAHVHSGVRGDRIVNILDWPDWCGPCPVTKPTWREIVDATPHPNAIPALEDDKGVLFTIPMPTGNTAGRPINKFLGYLIKED